MPHPSDPNESAAPTPPVPAAAGCDLQWRGARNLVRVTGGTCIAGILGVVERQQHNLFVN